jgi:hypothetical protein
VGVTVPNRRFEMMPRTILIHLNVELTEDDPRDAADIAVNIEEMLAASLLRHVLDDATVEIALAEEVGV